MTQAGGIQIKTTDLTLLAQPTASVVLPNIDEILSAPSISAAFRRGRPSRLTELGEASFTGFFFLAAKGHAFVDPARIRQRFGISLKQNYPAASQEFLQFATTYWTLKEIYNSIEIDNQELSVTKLISWLEQSVGSVFFPTPGPFQVPNNLREQAQRTLIAKTRAPIPVEAFIRGNPILRGR